MTWRGLTRRVPPAHQHLTEVGVQAYGPFHEAGAALVLARQGDGAAGHQLSTQPLELDAGALELGRGPGTAQGRLGGDLGRAPTQDAVRQQSVHGGARLGHGRLDTGQGEQGSQDVGHVSQR